MVAVAKHFPGHGDTQSDSHFGMPAINAGLDRLYELELEPFRRSIAAGLDAVMTAHIALPEVTGDRYLPATLSKVVLTDMLRNKMGFEGVVITDGLEGPRLVYDDGRWMMPNSVSHAVFEGGGSTLGSRQLQLDLRPADLIDITGDPRHMHVGSIAALIERRDNAGLDTVTHRAELHGRFAHPWLALWLLLVVAPWALDPRGTRSLAATLGAGVIVIAVVLAASESLRLLALAGHVPVIVGAWGVAGVCVLAMPASAAIHRRAAR